MNWTSNLGNMLLRVLRIPPGTSVRKANKSNDSNSNEILSSNDMINAIVDITVSDVCIGSAPLFFQDFKGQKKLKLKVKKFVDEANTIVRDVATDLLKRGYSVFEVSSVEDNSEVILFPVISDLEFYLDKKKQVHVFEVNDGESKELKDVIVFLNYNKESLTKDSDEKHDNMLVINPTPIQLKNIDHIGYDLTVTERSIAQYRRQLSKIVRLITFDAGISQGDELDNITEQISSMVNSESSSLASVADPAQDFDDAIPVLPNRRGVGKPELVESIPSADIKSLVDYDLLLKKLFLSMKFPQSYADFSSALGDTAVSTIRGDIRYSRMIDYTQTLIVGTLNAYLGKHAVALRGRQVIGITTLPNPEDADVIANMRDFTEFATSVSEFIFGAETYLEAKSRLAMLKSLFQATSSFKLIEEWETSMGDVLLQKYGETDGGSDPGNSDGDDLFDSPDDGSGDLFDSPDEGLDLETSSELSDDVTSDDAPSDLA